MLRKAKLPMMKHPYQEVENSLRGLFFLFVLLVLVSSRDIISGDRRALSQCVSHFSHSLQRELCVCERSKQIGPESNENLLLSEDAANQDN